MSHNTSISGSIPQKTAGQAILELLANDRRRVLSDWRALILLRNATASTPKSQRRWSNAPASILDINRVLRQMQTRGQIQKLDDFPGLYQVTVPYAETVPIADDEVLMEINPFAAISHLSALVFHGLSDQLPKAITLIVPAKRTDDLVPIGTDAEDWYGLPKVISHRPQHVLGRDVHWRQVSETRFFGIGTYKPRGYPVRVTTPERSLLDGLQEPELCGGLDNVLRAWAAGIDLLDIEALASCVERFDIDLLRQRVGFVLDELGVSHPDVEAWRAKAHRGGSSKLLSSAPYAPSFSERWSLSINYPVGALHEGRQ